MSLISKSKNFKLSAWQDNQIQFFVVQGEGGIKTAQFTLTDDNGVLDLTAVSSVTYNATKHNGTACCIDCSIVDAKAGAIELKIETGITDIVGNVDGEIEVINENGSIKFHGITICVKGGTVEDLIQASSEFSALVKALNKVALLTPEGTITLDDELTDEGINPAPSGVVKQYVDDAVNKKLDDTNGVVQTSHIANGAITGMKIASNAVSGGNIANNQIGTDHIIDGKITKAKLSSDVTDLFDAKYNASNIEEGTGSFIIEGQEDKIKSATFEYQRVGQWVTVFAEIKFLRFDITTSTNFCTLRGLPYVSAYAKVPREMCITNNERELVWAVQSNSNEVLLWAIDAKYILNNESLSFSFRYKKS